MPTLYLVPTHETRRMDRQWLKQATARLKGQGIQKLYGPESPLLTKLARNLGVPYSVDERLTAFRMGRHGHSGLDAMLTKAEGKGDWSIPISGGDSWLSYRKRLWQGFVQQFINRNGWEKIALVLEPRTIQTVKEVVNAKFNPNDVSPRRALDTVAADKIYAVRVNDAH